MKRFIKMQSKQWYLSGKLYCSLCQFICSLIWWLIYLLFYHCSSAQDADIFRVNLNPIKKIKKPRKKQASRLPFDFRTVPPRHYCMMPNSDPRLAIPRNSRSYISAGVWVYVCVCLLWIVIVRLCLYLCHSTSLLVVFCDGLFCGVTRDTHSNSNWDTLTFIDLY